MQTTPTIAPERPPGGRPFGTVLVANRGEIACRVIRTLRSLGIRSVAVFSDADIDAPHVRMADSAVRIGPAAAASSYLDVAAIVSAAVASGSEAVHPGYGFLSEHAGFARACAEAGLVFVGPSVEALEAMADKITAKELVGLRGVPVVPGSSGTGLDDDALTVAADEVGFPLLIKPSAGGGGKGMQVVRLPAELPAALASARRVATAAFGDDTLLLERLIESPRHIEVQVLADRAGATVHLGERECSLQRRHQKVIEEAPSPLLDAATRERIGAAACEVARSVGYEGAGTVEFLVADAAPDEFFFIEMNTRLQVEHPVTEYVTGIDLVEQQLRIAAGEPLPFAQSDIRLSGHAIEARVYAESTARGFLPATGHVLALEDPSGDGMRWDGGIAVGSTVGGDYDPMLAKAIAHGGDRAEALARLRTMLHDTVLLGVDTNVDELRAILADPDVAAGRLDTGLLDRRSTPTAPVPDHADLTLAALLILHDQRARTDSRHRSAGRGWDLDGWRALGSGRPTTVALVTGSAAGTPTLVRITGSPEGAQAEIGTGSGTDIPSGAGVETALHPGATAHAWRFRFGGVAETVHGVVDRSPASAGPASVWIRRAGRTIELSAPSRAEQVTAMLAALDRAERPTSPEVRTPMPGTVVAVAADDGRPVAVGDPIVTIEAMKMEHALTASVAGRVRVDVRVGDLVRRDQIVAVIEPDPAQQAPTQKDVA